MCVEFDEAADLLSADPEATTLSVSDTSTRAAGEDVKLDLTDEEEGEEESSEVSNHQVSPSLCATVVKTSFLFRDDITWYMFSLSSLGDRNLKVASGPLNTTSLCSTWTPCRYELRV